MTELKHGCLRCGGELAEGFVAVSLDGTSTPLFWVEGALTRERFTKGADVQGRERRPVLARRCNRCFNVDLAATDEAALG